MTWSFVETDENLSDIQTVLETMSKEIRQIHNILSCQEHTYYAYAFVPNGPNRYPGKFLGMVREQ